MNTCRTSVTLRVLTITLFIVGTFAAEADPRVTSWFTGNSGAYARVYKTTADETNLTATTTWDHPTGADQLTPTYAGLHEVSSTPDWVYIRTTNLASYIMGPWYGAGGGLFPNYPNNQAVLYRLPRNPANATNSGYVPGYSLTGGGPIGYFVDGVAMFDSRDAFSYNGTTDAQPGLGAWNRDAYVNEGATFDAGNAHQAGGRYHYHANPPGLRHLLGDSVGYTAATNTYTENFNGKHSPIIGWCRDGLPIYGPYGYSSALNPNSAVTRMRSGYQIRAGLTTRTAWPAWATRVYGATGQVFSNGPAVGTAFPLGRYMEDNDYKGDVAMTLGVDFDLNEYNARFCVTPEFPGGTWAYFTCINATGIPVFPYNIGRSYFLTALGNTAAAIPAPGDAGPVTTHFEGGPEKSDAAGKIEVSPGSGDITLTWSGVEGGRYEVDYSSNLLLWQSSGEMTATTDEPAMVDSGIVNTQVRQFYRTRRVGLSPFDATGFSYTPQTYPTLSTITVNITGVAGAPTSLSEDPSSVTFNGQSVIFVGRPSQNQVQFRVDVSALAAGTYPISVTFAGITGVFTGSYTVGPATSGNNILLLILDDWGLDMSPMDNTTVGASLPKMPTLQSLASNGIRFTQAYSMPLCSPTRAAMMTGRLPFRNGVGNPQANSTLAATELALPEVFTAQSSPYAMGSFGKWHLGGGNTGPSTRGGWPYFKGIAGGAVTDYFSWTKLEVINGMATTPASTTYTTTDQVNDAVSWIGSQGSTTPWLCWMAFNAPHDPFHEPPAGLAPPGGYTAGTGDRGMYIRMLEALDTEIGRLLGSFGSGVLAKTNIIVIGDNGTPNTVVQAPFGNGHSKGDLYQGGVRVPLFAKGPDISAPAGSTSDKLVTAVDLFSTILELGGINSAAATASVSAIDSKSLLPLLRGNADVADRTAVVEKFGLDATDGRALVSDDYPDYKLVIFGDRLSTTDTPTFEFYNITADPNEQSPLTIGSLTGTPLAAYNHLIAKDAALGGGYSDLPTVASTTLYVELPATGVNPPVPALTNANGAINVTSVTVNGQAATYVSRVNSGTVLADESDDAANQHWVKVTTTLSGPYTTANVVFPNTPGGAARAYNSINTILVKP